MQNPNPMTPNNEKEKDLAALIRNMPCNALLEKKKQGWITKYGDENDWGRFDWLEWGYYKTPEEALIAMFEYLRKEGLWRIG